MKPFDLAEAPEFLSPQELADDELIINRWWAERLRQEARGRKFGEAFALASRAESLRFSA